MEKRNIGGVLWSYLRRHLSAVVLTGAFVLLLFGVYGLYGLPWGPAVYTALLTLALAAALAAVGLGRYAHRLSALAHLEQQARNQRQLPELPPARDETEQAYQAVIHTLVRRCSQGEDQARRDTADARRYYTLWSHQIKTPLAAMGLLLREDPPDREALERELLKTGQYVDMVLQYQRLGGGTNDLVLGKVDLDSLVRKAAARTAPLFIHKRLTFHLDPLETQVVSDEKWLVFVLEQLLTNAAKYTRQGGVTVGPGPAPGQVVVADTGMGIRGEDLPRVFEWGYTGWNGREEQRSTGIGLCLCRQALEMLGHTISIQSVMGEGTQVLLDLSRPCFDME